MADHTAPASPTPAVTRLGWLLALAPAAAFVALAAQLGVVAAGQPLRFALNWLPSLNLRLGFALDGLGLLFALLITGIGALVFVYAGYYFAPSHGQPDTPARRTVNDARFFLYIGLFMLSMLGLVLAGDVITLFIFWEGTSILSFLLVAYKYKDEAARRGATKALVITGGGGIALLAGLMMMASVASSTQLADILAAGAKLRASPLYPVMLGLVAFGAFTKSAQFPAHHWLPAAMSAPTPASAYLHSATMVKAGIYLMARLHPALGGTDAWFALLVGAGALTLAVGSVKGLFQHDLKGVLAYSTIAQLGVLMLLIGWGTPASMKAATVGVLAHALYKGALFLVAGIVDHAAHTRDLRALHGMGLRSAMPLTFAAALLPALSMAGLPPLFGFLGKETLLAAVTQGSSVAWLMTGLIVIASALTFGQAAMLVLDSFATGATPPPGAAHAHDPARGMLFAPAILGGLSLLTAFDWLLADGPVTQLIATAAKAAYGEKVKVDLALFQGFNLPLLLSACAIGLGAAITWVRAPLRARLAGAALLQPTRLDVLYRGFERSIDRVAWLATRLQNGRIRTYLAIMMVAFGMLVVWFGGWRLPTVNPNNVAAQPLPALRVTAYVVCVGAALASVLLRRDLAAVLALGASGLGVTLVLALEPSPDVALVQIVVDILTTVILVLALDRMPPGLRDQAWAIARKDGPGARVRNLLVAGLGGAIMFVASYSALSTRPRTSIVTPFYETNSKPLTGAADIVGAIVVDFRGFDTMIEITVFGMAGAAVYALLQHATRKHGDDAAVPHPAARRANAAGPMIQMLARVVLPASMTVALVHMAYGHDQPGDGFTAGVIVSIAIGFMVLAYGRAQAMGRMRWLRPGPMIGAGWLLVMGGSLAPMLFGLPFFAPFDFGQWLGLPLPSGFYISTSYLFEVAIFLAVIGSAGWILTSFERAEAAKQ